MQGLKTCEHFPWLMNQTNSKLISNFEVDFLGHCKKNLFHFFNTYPWKGSSIVTLDGHNIDKAMACSCWAKQQLCANTKYNFHVSLTLKCSLLKCFSHKLCFYFIFWNYSKIILSQKIWCILKEIAQNINPKCD